MITLHFEEYDHLLHFLHTRKELPQFAVFYNGDVYTLTTAHPIEHVDLPEDNDES